MKYFNREIAELHDLALIQAVQDCKEIVVRRNEAAKHPKFNISTSNNVGAFPDINPAFLELQSELENEMNKRKLESKE